MARSQARGRRRCSSRSGSRRARAPRTSARRSRRSRSSRGETARRSSPGTGASTPRRCARSRFDLDEAEVKPYFPLERDGRGGVRLRGAPVRRLRSSPGRDIAVYHPDVSVYEVRDAAGDADRPLPARQLRAADQAQRRLDERVPHAVEQRRRRRGGAADHRQQQQLREGRARRADAAELRRRAHAVPRVRPRPARAAVERHLRARSRAPACCAISSSCRRSCSSTGSTSPRC